MDNKSKDIIYTHLVNTNEPDYNLTKACEELNELSEVILKRVNKGKTPKSPENKAIIEEIGDVEIRLNILKRIFGLEDCEQRVHDKLTKFEGYIAENKYTGRI